MEWITKIGKSLQIDADFLKIKYENKIIGNK